MAKIKLTKGELKRQRDSLQQFRHYLPILQLKKKQLQIKIEKIRRVLAEKIEALSLLEDKIRQWQGLLADPLIDIKPWLEVERVTTFIMNIAGAEVPVFEEVSFKQISIDYYSTPFWIDKGIQQLRDFIAILIEIEILKKQINILEKELRTTTQRVNLFEKIKIPECLNNIRIIRIYLGDMQANAVGIGKIAKKKVAERTVAGTTTL